MLRSYLRGARVALSTWRAAILFWLVGALFGLAFAALSGEWLARGLNGALATRTLLTDLDPNVLIDLYYNQYESGGQLVRTAGVLAIVYLLLWFWLSGVAVVIVRAQGAVPLRQAVRDGLDLAARMSAIFAAGVVLLALLCAAIIAPAWWLVRNTRESSSEMTFYYIVMPAAVLCLLAYVFVAAVNDQARLRTAATDGATLPAYWWALRFVMRGGELAFPLAVLLQITGVVIWAAYQAVALAVPVTTGWGVTLSFIWAELFLLARMLLRLWFFAAQNDLQT